MGNCQAVNDITVPASFEGMYLSLIIQNVKLSIVEKDL